MTVASPWLGLLALASLLLLWIRRSRSERPAVTFAGLDDFRSAPTSTRVVAAQVRPWFHLAALLLLVVALARPRAGSLVEVVKARGVDIMIALDVSGSMSRGRDLPPNRLEVAKNVLAAFVEGRRHDRIGLVVFAGAAFMRCPLTLDYGILRGVLSGIVEGTVETDGTAIGMGLASCVARLRDSDAKSQVVVLLTDGANNSGSIGPEEAAALAKERGIKVYTVGVGGDGRGALSGPLAFLARAQPPELDEPLLRRIAEKTGGRYFRATDARSLEAIFQTIDRLETSELESHSFVRHRELAPPLLLLASLILLLDLILSATVLRTLP